MKNKDNYACKKCGFIFPKSEVKISGFESHPNGLHVHCPKCGFLVDSFVKLKSK